MNQAWRSLFEASSTLQFLALGAQASLAWIFALVLSAFRRVTEGPAYFRIWTWSWFARALGLSAILVRFQLYEELRPTPEIVNAQLFSSACFWVYQSCKLLSLWWLLEGALVFVSGTPARQSRRIPLFLVLTAGLSVVAARDVEDLLIYQAPLVVATSAAAAWMLARLPASRQNAGTRLAILAFLVQTVLWCVYFYVFLRGGFGFWLLEPSPIAKFAAHNSYFDLVVDVMVASSLVVLLLQDVHRRQVAAETERARLRAELDRSERLRSLGTLVSGVAHELNNPLTSILGFAETLHEQVEAGQARAVEIIREQALRCRRIVRGLSSFAGTRSQLLEHVDVGQLLGRVVRGLEFELQNHGVRVTVKAAPGLELTGDGFALEQMVANLLSNAIQASPREGVVSLSAQPTREGLELVVEDEGPGIPAEFLERVFDPFFTTRPTGQGMGLGLAVVHGIVQAHGGRTLAENREPHGARMRVLLPKRDALEATPGERLGELPQREIPRPVRPPATPTSNSPSNCLALLVIDDEPLLCELLREVGLRRGWRVTVCTSGQAGLELLERDEPADVVLCDLRMASLSGIEIHDRLLPTRPRLLERFLFVTGDLGSDEAATFARRCTRPILQKPFRIEELARRIEETVRATRVG